MAKILIKDNALLILDEANDLFEWNHRAFFNIGIGFEVDEESGSYKYTNTNNFPAVVEEVLNYFKEEAIVVEVDQKVREIAETLRKQNEEFEKVKEELPTIPNVPIASTLVRPLKPYQLKGLEHLIKVQHGANFSVPGSGKTTMVYAYFDKLRKEGVVEKLFVVGPFSSFSPWEDESKECFGSRLNSARLVGSKRQSYYLQSEDFDLFLCHFQTAANDEDEIIQLCRKHKLLFVIDESHYMKRFEGGAWSTALLTISPFATRRVVLSGTPMPNGLKDLWSQMTFLWPGKQLLGERVAYKARCEDETQTDGIKADIKPFFYRVTKNDLQLPKPKFYRTEYDLKPIQAQIYNALSVRLLSELNIQPLDRIQLKQWRKSRMVRLLQTASNPSLLARYSEEFELPPLSSDGSSLVELIQKYSTFEMPAKFAAALSLLKKLVGEGKKVVIWTSFVHNIKMLESSMADVNHYTIHGAIPKDDKADEDFNRERQINEFKTTNTPSVLIANPAACAESISLHRVCHDAIYLDRTFNCGQFLQSLDRIHRIGLGPKEQVNYHILIAKNTIDEVVDERLDDKEKRMLRILEDEVPIGSFDVEGSEMELTDQEEALDFEATVKHTRKIVEGSQKTKRKK